MPGCSAGDEPHCANVFHVAAGRMPASGVGVAPPAPSSVLALPPSCCATERRSCAESDDGRPAALPAVRSDARPPEPMTISRSSSSSICCDSISSQRWQWWTAAMLSPRAAAVAARCSSRSISSVDAAGFIAPPSRLEKE